MHLLNPNIMCLSLPCLHVCSVMSDSWRLHGLYLTRLLCPQGFPGKNTRAGCHFLLQGGLPNPGSEPTSLASPTLTGEFFTTEPLGSPQWNITTTTTKSLQSCPTLCDPIDGSPPGSTVPGILQARTLEWVAISFSNA